MYQCTLLKEFHEKYPEFIELVESLRDSLLQKGTFNNIDFGGSRGEYSTRINVTQSWTSLKITHNDFAFQYYVMHRTDPRYQNTFYSNGYICAIEFGPCQNKNSVSIHDGYQFNCTLTIPVLEEEYFQYLTVAALSAEEVYEYFADIYCTHQSVLQMTVQNDGYDKFAALLEDKNTMKNLKKDIDLVCFAYKRTNGL